MILSCGEALIDMIPTETADGAAFRPLAGGAVYNTAMALGRLGAPSGFFSGLSSDLFGTQLRDVLAASHVTSDLSIIQDRPTTLAFVTLVNGHAKYAFYDENTAGRMITPDQLPDLPANIGALFFGGISLVGEPCGGTYEALALREASSRVIMVDPNIRPSFIKDEASYRARLDRMLGVADMVKLSDEDLDWLVGADGTLDDKVAHVLAKGPQIVLITLGADGAAAWHKNGTKVQVGGRKAQVVDTVGAGDSFNAGVLASLHAVGQLTKAGVAALDEDHLRAALDQGNAVAAITVSRAGCNPPWASEL